MVSFISSSPVAGLARRILTARGSMSPVATCRRISRNIPDDSPKENVKASVPDTAQAQDALVANDIPQMAEVNPAKVQFLRTKSTVIRSSLPIEGTPLSYVTNSPAPIIKVDDYTWYAVQNGVWFTASSVTSPWSVANSVPSVIYSIPPTSPLYYVTFVKIYDATQRE